MKILVIDTIKTCLFLAMRFEEAGHEVRYFLFPLDSGKANPDGDGVVGKVKDWKPSMGWADLIVITDNSIEPEKFEPYFKQGYPIFGCNAKAAELELDRETGQKVFQDCGIEVVPFKSFKDYDKAIAYVEKEKRPFVSKPWGGESDKSLSYVPKGATPIEAAANLVSQLEHWKKQGLKADFILQEMVEGDEMAVGGWFGPHGWNKWVNENWEEKRLMNDGFGPNTGEMGTVLRYVKKSKLFDDVCEPVTEKLLELGYVGYVDVNCIVTKEGTPIPLEFTMRFGEPHYKLAMHMHKGDPAKWMLDLVKGKDTLDCEEGFCVGIVMGMGDYPWGNADPLTVTGHPIRGITDKNREGVYFSSVMLGEAPVVVGGKITRAETYVSSGEYTLTVCATGKTVAEAAERANELAEEINWPPHITRRTDIGKRLEKGLPELQVHGYAKGARYGKS
jgi:phosphoribosylamine--glycine ligase